MKKIFIACLLFALLPLVAALKADTDVAGLGRSLWIGSHYTELSDYSRKVGEYNLGDDEFLPEFQLLLAARGPRSDFALQSHYYDHRNILGTLNGSIGGRAFGRFQYRSLTRQAGQDQLANLETREWLSNRPGGKILTHELADSGADYNLHRQEITSQIDLRLSAKHDLRMMVAHRSLLEKGHEQSTASTHCYSCHVVSQTARMDKQTHQVEAGLQGDLSKVILGYAVNFRTTKNSGDPAMMHYDSASHPVSGASGPEFQSRQIFDDTTLAVGVGPKTRKLSHKARLKGELAGGQWSSALIYSQTKNLNTEVAADAYGASLNYTYPLSKQTRLTMRASAMRQKVDDKFIDLPTYRAGRPGPQFDFDFTRYSSLNRLSGLGSIELVTRLNPKTLLSVLASFNRIERDDYPYHGADFVTSKATGRAKLRYRPSSKLSTSLAYKFEKTTYPFASGRGLFEAPGRDVLEPLAENFSFIFYFQREALRYQTITSLPTDRHEINLGGTLVASAKSNLSVNFKGTFDKNGKLDSLDVKHAAINPTIDFTMTPSQRWVYSLGYGYHHDLSRLPVAMPLFDG